jgi:hypothetical protein
MNMRTIKEIKAGIAYHESEQRTQYNAYREHLICQMKAELLDALTFGTSFDRIEVIFAAEKEGRYIVLPYPIGAKLYYTDTDGVLKGHTQEIVVHGYSESEWQGRVNAEKDSRFIICHNSYNEPHAYQLRNIHPVAALAEKGEK